MYMKAVRSFKEQKDYTGNKINKRSNWKQKKHIQ